MGRLTALGFALALAVAALLGGAPGLRSAQEGTPAATPVIDTPAEVTDEPLASGEVELGGARGCQGGCGRLALRRYTLAPGERIPDQIVSESAAIYVDAGTIAFTALEGEIQLTRAQIGAAASPVATPDATPGAGLAAEETLPVGSEVLLNAGDALFHARDAAYEFRNDGATPAVVLVAFLGLVEPGPEEGCQGGC